MKVQVVRVDVGTSVRSSQSTPARKKRSHKPPGYQTTQMHQLVTLLCLFLAEAALKAARLLPGARAACKLRPHYSGRTTGRVLLAGYGHGSCNLAASAVRNGGKPTYQAKSASNTKQVCNEPVKSAVQQRSVRASKQANVAAYTRHESVLSLALLYPVLTLVLSVAMAKAHVNERVRRLRPRLRSKSRCMSVHQA